MAWTTWTVAFCAALLAVGCERVTPSQGTLDASLGGAIDAQRTSDAGSDAVSRDVAAQDGPRADALLRLDAPADADAMRPDGTGAADAGDGGAAHIEAAVATKKLKGVVELAMGSYHGCARMTDGTVRCWGQNDSRQIGDGDLRTARTLAVKVAGLEGVTRLVSQGEQSCALDGSKKVFCWGHDAFGRPGKEYGKIARPAEMQHLAGSRDVALSRRVGGGGCVVRNGGSVDCWVGQAAPTPVAGATSAVELALGISFGCARHTDGTVSCWGANASGQLAQPSATRQSAAAVKVSGLADAVGISAGLAHACAVLASGKVVCWGNNAGGQLGAVTGEKCNTSLPNYQIGCSSRIVEVAGLPPAVEISAGRMVSCARLRGDGSIRCWGWEGAGLALSRIQQPKPEPVAGVRDARQIALASETGCALLANGEVDCWGDQRARGDGTGETSPLPMLVPNLVGVVQVAAGAAESCARHADGTVSCWGWKRPGSDGSVAANADDPAPVPRINAVDLVVGNGNACAREGDGKVFCWDLDYGAPSCEGSEAYREEPEHVTDWKRATQLSMTGRKVCARMKGNVPCVTCDRNWKSRADRSSTIECAKSRHTEVGEVRQIALGTNHSCAVSDVRTVTCWGDNSYGQLGDGTAEKREQPVTVAAIGDAAEVAVGAGHTCVRGVDGSVKCWGANHSGQLGDGSSSRHRGTAAVVKELPPATSISLGDDFGCALLGDHTMRCWGNNTSGQLGNGGYASSPLALPVPGLTHVKAISAGGAHVCALVEREQASRVVCWGSSSNGQVGPSGQRTAPTRVLQASAP